VIVGVDTMVLIWWMPGPVNKAYDAQTTELRTRAKILLDVLDEEKKQVVVPTITVAELLAPIAAKDHGRFVAEVTNRFICPPFDLRASSLAAQLWTLHKSFPKEMAFQDRPLLKVDMLIVATARAAGATEFYSHDARCRKLAEALSMKAHDLPKRHPNMFVDSEIRKREGR
jgi:predicted nucleic acid-binding protein